MTREADFAALYPPYGLDHPINRWVRQALQQMKSSGEARADIDIEILSYIFLGMVSTLVMLSRLPGSDTEELAQRFAREFSSFMRTGIYAQAGGGAQRRQGVLSR